MVHRHIEVSPGVDTVAAGGQIRVIHCEWSTGIGDKLRADFPSLDSVPAKSRSAEGGSRVDESKCNPMFHVEVRTTAVETMVERIEVRDRSEERRVGKGCRSRW